MILKCFVLTTALQVVLCINGKLSMNQRKCPFNSDFDGPTNIAGTDAYTATSLYDNYFPDVIYPTCILDITEPFYYTANGYDEVLGPFDEDVKSAYKFISSNNNKHKTNNLPKIFDGEKLKCMPVKTFALSNKNNTREQNVQKSLVYNNEISKDICKQNKNSICSEKILTSNESNDTETSGYCEFNDISLITSLYSLLNESETDVQNCDIITSIEYENLTNSVCNGSNELTEMEKYSLLQNTISDDRVIRIKVKINIEVSEVPGQYNGNTTRDLKAFPYEILEYISSGENETFLDKDTNKNYSVEEISVFPDDILNILLNSSNHTDLVFTELLTELLSESSEETENFYSLLQLLNENNLDVTKIELPLNGTICNTLDNHDYIESLKIHVKRDENTTISDNDNTTTNDLTEDVEDYEETDDGVFFLDFIISLDTLCQRNDTVISDNLYDSKPKYIAMYSYESSSEEA